MMRLLRAIANLFSVTFWKAALGIEKAATDQIVNSADGIEATMKEYGDQLKDQTEKLITDLGGIEQTLTDLDKQKKEVVKRREVAQTRLNGAIAIAADRKSTADEVAEAKEKAKQFRKELESIKQEEEQLQSFIDEQGQMASRLESDLREMQTKVKNLDAETRAKVAKFNLLNRITEANKRSLNLIKSIDTSKKDAIDQRLDQMAAEARVTTRMADLNKPQEGDKYLQAGSDSADDDDIDAMIAKRSADNDAREQAAGDKPVVPEKREKI